MATTQVTFDADFASENGLIAQLITIVNQLIASNAALLAKAQAAAPSADFTNEDTAAQSITSQVTPLLAQIQAALTAAKPVTG